MSGLDTLRRLYAWRLDEARRELGALNRDFAELAEERDKLSRSVAAEAAVEARDPVDAILCVQSYSAYLGDVIARRRAIAEQLAALELEIAGAEARVADALRDVKACETVLERREAERDKLERRRQQGVEDDAGRRLVRHGIDPIGN